MTKTVLLGVTLTALFVASMLVAPAIAASLPKFLTITEAEVEVNEDSLEADLETKKTVPTDGSGGAFGYGVITDSGLSAIIVTTTHAGVQDSEAQSGPSDPVMHNHYVALTDSDANCPGLAVQDITFEEPGDVVVSGKNVKIEDVPLSFTGTHSLTGAEISFDLDPNVGAAVSFTLAPVFDNEDIVAVCVNDVQAAQNLEVDD